MAAAAYVTVKHLIVKNRKRLSSLALMHIRYDVPVDADNTVDLIAAMFPRKLELKNMTFS